MMLNLLTPVLLLSFGVATAASEEHEVQDYHFGQEASIVVDDNTGDCVFELEQKSGRTCCFAREVLLDELCPKSKQTGTGCREWGAESESSRYTVKHRRKEDDFILLLPNFQESDVNSAANGLQRPPAGTQCVGSCKIESGRWGSSYCYTDSNENQWGAECIPCSG